MVGTWVDFKRLKTDAAIEQVVAQYGVHLRRVGATELRGRCPLPTHSSSRSRDSFSVNVERNVWSCRSQSCVQARGGRVGGNILDLVALMEGCGVRDAALRLQAWCGSATGHTAPRSAPPVPALEPNRPLGFTLRHVNLCHPYLTARGLTADSVRAFGMGAYSGNGLLRGRIVIPIHNEGGELIAYAGCAIGAQEPKYRFPVGFRKSLVLYNLHRALETRSRTVIVVEGFFDTLAVHQAGYPTVAALMGSTLSRRQADLLCTHFDQVLLMLDGDAAGCQGSAAISDVLTSRVLVSVISLRDGKQPDQLAPEEIRRLVRSHERGALRQTPTQEHAATNERHERNDAS
jgi:DNA primase